MQNIMKKQQQLKMSYGKANGILKKAILFELIKKCKLDICYRCNKQIENVSELTVEHKIPWLDSDDPIKVFFDLENITFSHYSCNYSAARNANRGTGKHPSIQFYKKGCRCAECTKLASSQKQRMRLKTRVKH